MYNRMLSHFYPVILIQINHDFFDCIVRSQKPMHRTARFSLIGTITEKQLIGLSLIGTKIRATVKSALFGQIRIIVMFRTKKGLRRNAAPWGEDMEFKS